MTAGGPPRSTTVIIDLRPALPFTPAGEYALHLTAGLGRLELPHTLEVIAASSSPEALPAGDVLLLPAGGLPRPGYHVVAAVSDLSHLLAPRRLGLLAAARRGLGIAFRAHRSDRLFAPSRLVADGLVRYLRARPEAVSVVSPGLEHWFRRTSAATVDDLRTELELPDRYVVAWGDPRRAREAFAAAEKPRDAGLVVLEEASVARERWPALLSGAVGTLLLDRACGCPIFALMAMACGSPPVVAGDAAYPELVRDGGLVASDAAEWRDAIAALFRSRALRSLLSTQARKLAAALTAEASALQLLPLLDR